MTFNDLQNVTSFHQKILKSLFGTDAFKKVIEPKRPDSTNAEEVSLELSPTSLVSCVQSVDAI